MAKKKKHKRPTIPQHKELQQPKYRARTHKTDPIQKIIEKDMRDWMEDCFYDVTN